MFLTLSLGGIYLSLSRGRGDCPSASTPQRLLTGLREALDRLRRSKALQQRTIFLALVFVLVFGFTLNAVRSTGAWSVLIDGQVIATVDNRPQFEEQLQTLLGQLEQDLGREVALAGELAYVRAPSGTATVAAAEAAQELKDRLPLGTTGCYILVNGEPAVACNTREEAEQAVALLMDEYKCRLTAKSGVDILRCGFQEQIEYEEGAVDFARLHDCETAAEILERGTDKVVEHQVKKGESLWAIARGTGMSESDLRKANPQVKGDLIRIGDVLNLVVPDPYLNLTSVETYTYKQAIAYATKVQSDAERWPWERVITQAGKSGQKEVTVEISRVNGEEVSRKLISETLLSSPVTQIVLQGTKTIPNRGTGTLVWPVVGRITSPFGWRGREHHNGIDIGAPRGTPVLAADTGTVIASSYAGTYGNCIRIDHGGGSFVTLYAHLSKRLVAVGDVVTKGQTIGEVGSTGRSTGNHLHFETRINGKAVNPIQFYPSG